MKNQAILSISKGLVLSFIMPRINKKYEIIDVNYSFEENGFLIKLACNEFPPTQEGLLLPRLIATMKEEKGIIEITDLEVMPSHKLKEGKE